MNGGGGGDTCIQNSARYQTELCILRAKKWKKKKKKKEV